MRGAFRVAVITPNPAESELCYLCSFLNCRAGVIFENPS